MNLFIDRCSPRGALTVESGPTVPRARQCLVHLSIIEIAVELQPTRTIHVTFVESCFTICKKRQG